TNATDGRNSLEEMAAAAQMLGFEYLAIAEPSRRASMPQGLDSDRIRRQGELIDRLNAKSKGLRLLKGIEVDILDDGRLDLPDSVLAELDVVVAAVHSRFDVGQARRGWLTREDVLNARGLRELLPLLARERVRPRASRAKAHAA